jgi:hypothetical protein
MLARTEVISERPPISRPPAAGTAWREEAFVRAAELEVLAHSAAIATPRDDAGPTLESIFRYLDVARAAAAHDGPRLPWQRAAVLLGGSEVLRAAANLDAAEAALLNLMPPGFVEAQLPALLTRVRSALASDDPRRHAVEDLARRPGPERLSARDQAAVVSALHAANSTLRRQLVTVRSFRNVVWATTAVLAVLAVALAVLAALTPDALSLCFTSGADVYCPTGAHHLPSSALAGGVAGSWDVALVEVVGLVAAAVTAAAALSRVRGTATPYSIPIALGLLKLPTGAVTAVLGLVLLRGEFVPGLEPLSSSAEILAWAIVFGAAQQLFTGFVDRRGNAVLQGADAGGDRPRSDTVSLTTEVSRAVSESLQAALAEPLLVDYAGRVEAWIEHNGRVVPSDDGSFQASASGEYALVVALGDLTGHAGPSRPIEIVGGVRAEEAEFEISLASTSVHVPPQDHHISAPTSGEVTRLTTPIVVSGPGDHGVSISVLQQGRLVQILDLRLVVEA